jgi:hypothetical protein
LGGEEDWDGGVVGVEVLGGRWGSEKVVRDAGVNRNGELSQGVLMVTCERLAAFFGGWGLIAMLVDAEVDLGTDFFALFSDKNLIQILKILRAYMEFLMFPYVLVYISTR